MPFEPRPLPEAVFLGEECIAGPFCIHCGWPLSLHGPQLRCRRDPCVLMPPICDCHEIREVEELQKRSGRRGMPRRVVKVKRIVRVAEVVR